MNERPLLLRITTADDLRNVLARVVARNVAKIAEAPTGDGGLLDQFVAADRAHRVLVQELQAKLGVRSKGGDDHGGEVEGRPVAGHPESSRAGEVDRGEAGSAAGGTVVGADRERGRHDPVGRVAENGEGAVVI